MGKKYHFIFDLDQTLIHAWNANKPNVAISTKNLIALPAGVLHFITDKFIVAIRPYTTILLRYLIKNGHQISFWSHGMMKKYIDIITDKLTKHIRETDDKTINKFEPEFILARKSENNGSTRFINKKNKKIYDIPHFSNGHTKPLTFLFSHEDFKKACHPSSTILIDDLARHKALFGKNTMFVPPYHVTNSVKDQVLLKILQWVHYQLKGDVRKMTYPDWYVIEKRGSEESHFNNNIKKDIEWRNVSDLKVGNYINFNNEEGVVISKKGNTVGLILESDKTDLGVYKQYNINDLAIKGKKEKKTSRKKKIGVGKVKPKKLLFSVYQYPY